MFANRSGLPIWTPYLGFLGNLFGGLHVCRVLHPWMGVAFAAASVLMFIQWVSQMTLTPADRHFITPRGMLEYFQYRNEDSDVGKYNGGPAAPSALAPRSDGAAGQGRAAKQPERTVQERISSAIRPRTTCRREGQVPCVTRGEDRAGRLARLLQWQFPGGTEAGL